MDMVIPNVGREREGGLPEGHYPMKPLSVREDDVLSPLSLWGEGGGIDDVHWSRKRGEMWFFGC